MLATSYFISKSCLPNVSLVFLFFVFCFAYEYPTRGQTLHSFLSKLDVQAVQQIIPSRDSAVVKELERTNILGKVFLNSVNLEEREKVA